MKIISKFTRPMLFLFCTLLFAGALFGGVSVCPRITALADSSSLSSAECMVTMEASSKRVLYSTNMHKRRPMASVTKILTAITVLENCPNINAKISVPLKAQGVEGSSIYLQAGEKISIIDLLYGLMLQSGNDCAVALALSISGSIEDFAQLMNQTAKKAGAINSNFVNPHGLHHDNHYTTAYDLALITAYAMQNPTFKEITSSKIHKIERSRQDAITSIPNKNRLLSSFDGADGVKTGFTKKAGRCLVSSATRDGMQIISVVLNCGPMFADCARLMDAAFREFKLVCIGSAGEKLADVPIENGKLNSVSAGLAEDVYYPLRANEAPTSKYLFDDNLKAPIKKGTRIGQVAYNLNGNTLLTCDLCALDDAAALDLGDYLKDILHKW